jgi:hypothetical protein
MIKMNYGQFNLWFASTLKKIRVVVGSESGLSVGTDRGGKTTANLFPASIVYKVDEFVNKIGGRGGKSSSLKKKTVI